MKRLKGRGITWWSRMDDKEAARQWRYAAKTYAPDEEAPISRMPLVGEDPLVVALFTWICAHWVKQRVNDPTKTAQDKYEKADRRLLITCRWLMLPALKHQRPATKAFTRLNTRAVRKELDALVEAPVTDLPALIAFLHEPTIIALANVGVMRPDLLRLSQAERRRVVTRAKIKVPRGASGTPTGRVTEDARATAVTRLLVDEYERFTFRDRERAKRREVEAPRELIPVVADVFRHLGIRANAKAMVQTELDARERARQAADQRPEKE